MTKTGPFVDIIKQWSDSILQILKIAPNGLPEWDALKHGWSTLYSKNPRLDPNKNKEHYSIVDSAEEAATATKRMMYGLRRCALYKERGEALQR
eukprot:3480548-Lingulodinium_polyedra.AAC.1